MTAQSSLLGFIARISLLTSLTALSIDTMLPALPTIGESLGVENSNDLQLIITLVFLGMFFGELFFGPLSDSLGRKKALAVGIIIYCIGTVVAMTATTLHLLLVGRIIQGVGVSGPKIISRAMIRDQFEGPHMARVFSFIMTLFIVIPMVAPMLGQYILEIASWRAIFFLFLVIAIVSFLWIMIQQPETLAPENRQKIKIGLLLKTSIRILKHPLVISYSATAGLAFTILLLFLSTSQAMFEQIYYKKSEFPLYIAILATGFGLATLMNSRLVMKYGMFHLCLGAVIGLTALGAASLIGLQGGGHSFLSFMVGCYIMMFCIGLLFPNLSAMAMQPLKKAAGLGAALISAISSIIAVPVSIFVGRFFNNTLLPLALTIMVCGILSLFFLYLAKRSEVKILINS